MKKHVSFYRQLVLLVVLAAFNQVLSAQNKFEYKLVKPGTYEVIMKSSDELLVEIQFNAEAVNEAGAYVATFINGTMGRFIAATTMESPFTNTIKGSRLKEGNNSIEYALLPSGKMEISEALAIEKINIVLEESAFKVDEEFVRDLVKTIQENDVTDLLSYSITQEALDKMTQSKKEDAPKVTAIKAELKAEDIEDFRKQITDGFNTLQKGFAEKNVNPLDIELDPRLRREIILEMPEFNATKVECLITSGDSRTIVKMNVFVTKNETYLFDLGIGQL